MSRKETPDILGALMGENIKHENPKAIKHVFNKTTHDEPPQGRKEKTTFNLPIKILTELEDKWHEIRKLAGSKQISKTLMVEEALKMAFEEFDQKKQVGKFYCNMVRNKEIK